MKRDLAKLALVREEEALDFLVRWNEAADAVLADLSVWLEEDARTDAPLVQWPARLAPRGWLQALGLLTEAKVMESYVKFASGRFGAALPPMVASHPGFQTLLRVVLRAADAGEAALVEHYGGKGRMSLAREYQKMQRELDAAVAFKTGRLDMAAAAAGGMSRTAAYDALNRARSRK